MSESLLMFVRPGSRRQKSWCRLVPCVVQAQGRREKEYTFVTRIRAAFDDVVRTQGDNLPLPGAGETWVLFQSLAKWAAQDLSLGRLVEGHTDAMGILAEAGKQAVSPGASYGVWAARSRTGGTTACLEADGWHLAGHKAFCSGSGLIDRALVTADTPDGYRLFDIEVAQQVTSSRLDSWQAVGMADSMSETLEFGGPAVPADRVVGAPGFYLDRPGFWFGAVAVAACWYGGAAGLVESVLETVDPASPDLVVAQVGEAVAHVEAMRYVLENAAGEIDADPRDEHGSARVRALVVRHAVHEGARRVLDHVAAATGARPFCHDRVQAQRAADLFVYLAQHHGPQDAALLGRAALEGRVWS
jgi:alkylation response protein AidB-like acyl-CoA dehydrogenase